MPSKISGKPSLRLTSSSFERSLRFIVLRHLSLRIQQVDSVLPQSHQTIYTIYYYLSSILERCRAKMIGPGIVECSVEGSDRCEEGSFSRSENMWSIGHPKTILCMAGAL